MVTPIVDQVNLNTFILVLIAFLTALTTWLQKINGEHAKHASELIASTTVETARMVAGVTSETAKVLAAASQATATALAETTARTVEVLTNANARVEQKLDSVARVADNTHTLVNNQMRIQLQLVATSARALANLTHDPADVAAADTADERLRRHLEKQAVVDLTPAPPASSQL